jgi:general secretion pathway protein L
VNELRLYLQRDGLHDGLTCPWALLDGEGHVVRTGASIAEVPRAPICRVVIEADRVATVAVDLPALPPRRLAPLLANAVETATLEEAENLHVSLLGRSAEGKALCAVVSAPWLERMLGKLAEHGLYPDEAIVESLLLPHQLHAWTLVANEGSSLLCLDDARAYSIDGSDPPAGLRLALAREGRPARLHVYQGTRVRMPDLDAWRTQLGIDIEACGVWDWRTSPWRSGVNLLTGRFAARRAGLDFRGLLRPLGWGMAALAAIQILGLGLDTYLLKREQSMLQDEQRQLAKRVLPAGAKVIDPAWQVTEAYARLSGGGQGAQAGMLDALARLGSVWPALPGPKLRNLNYSGDTLEIAMSGQSEAWLAQLKAGAERIGLNLQVAEQGSGFSLRVNAARIGGEHGR